MTDLQPADVVTDSEDDDADRAAVLGFRGRADAVEAYGGMTVAETNPGHPADAEVAEVAFLSDLGHEEPGWRPRPHVEPWTAFDVDTYSFPVTRLELDGEECAHCGRRVPRLYAHLLVCHTGLKHAFPDDGVCPVCGGEYDGAGGLIQHARRSHERDDRMEAGR